MIIPDRSAYVKLLEKKESKWKAKKAQSQAMAYRLCRFPELKNRAMRMVHCSDITHTYICRVCGYPHIKSGGYCRDRMCPLCEWRLSMTKYAQMVAVLDTLTEEFQSGLYGSMLTLTVRNMPIQELHSALQSMCDAWGAVRKRKAFASVVGWARNIEITHNGITNTYHPHVHILLFWNGEENPDKQAKLIAKEWDKQLGLDYQSVYHHELAYLKRDTSAEESAKSEAECAAAEAAMYALSSSTLMNIPSNELGAFAEAIKGVRLTAYGGIIRDIRKRLSLKDEEIDDEKTDDRIERCPKCGGEMLHIVQKWNNGTYQLMEG